VGASDARIHAAVGATVDAGTAHFETLLESEPAAVTRSRSQGVCDFTHRRETSYIVTEVPEHVPDVFQITDGGVVYSQDRVPGETGDQWFVLDMGSWASASLLSMLGWLYGTVDAQAGASGEHTVTMSARRAVETCPEPLREELRAAFALVGHLDAVATGRVRTDAANRVTECRLELPGGGEDGLFGSSDVRARVTLTLSDFGEPAAIQPPDAGPALPIKDCIEPFLRREEESG
jgi:hypothetical protein